MLNYEKIWLNKLIVNRFEILKPISIGGMGAIFLAFDNNLQKKRYFKNALDQRCFLKS